jgi:4-hydroxy-3-methylbut-2-enyl diphosphate reductase
VNAPGASPDLLLLVPLVVERAALLGVTGGAVVRQVGMGPRRALAAARRTRGIAASAVAVMGFCGALTDDLRPGDLVVARSVEAVSGDARRTTAAAGPLVAALRACGLTRVHVGQVISSPRIAHGHARERLAARGAIAVDMESAWLASGSDSRPFAVLRVVVDTPSTRLSDPRAALRGFIEAERVLRRAAPAVTRWAGAAGERRVLLASPRSFCAGAQRAIAIVERALERYGTPLYVRNQIVHNAHVVHDLERRGVRFVVSLDEVPAGARCIFSAHGVAPVVRDEAARRGLKVIDATCPLVAKIHREARRFAASGHRIVLVGHAGHDEVVGTLGEAPDATVVVSDREGVDALRLPDGAPVAYLTQTTLAVDEVDEVVARLRERFPQLAGPRSADVCYATSNRQEAVRRIAREADLVLVIGSANSSNSRRLAEIAEREGCAARLVDDDTDLDPAWLAGRRTIGVTAGASAPEELVDRVLAALSGFGRITVEERCAGTEDVEFTLPLELAGGDGDPLRERPHGAHAAATAPAGAGEA